MENYDYDTTLSLSDVRREMMKTAADQQKQIDALTERLASTNNAVDDLASANNFSGIVNILDNSLPEWSKAAYDTTTVLPGDAGDGNCEAKNWYRQLASDTALTPATAPIPAMRSSAHSLFPANEGAHPDIPRWNKTNAWFEMGGVTDKWDLYYPIPNDIVYPGHRFTLQFEAMLSTNDAMPSGMQCYAGYYDNSPGQQKYIEGGAFTITDDQGNAIGIPFGIPGDGTTPADYQILARTDSGEEALSNILSFPNAPAEFTQDNHPRVRFAGVPGFIEFEIYRKRGANYVLQFTVRNTIDGTYYDIGNPPEAHVSSFPVVLTTAPRAFAVTTHFIAGTINGLGFIRNAMTIFVPTTYNRSLTLPGQQFLRMGFTLNTIAGQKIYIRKLGLSMGDGNWARSAHDTQAGAHSTPSGSEVTSSPPSGGGGGGGGGVPPPAPTGGGGGGGCVLLETMVRLDDGEVPLRDLRKAKQKGRRVDGGGPVYRPIKGCKFSHASHILRIATENRLEIGCTDAHPFITSASDNYGTSAAELKAKFDAGERVVVLTKPHDEIVPAWVVSIKEEVGDFTVGDPTVDGGLFVGNGFLLHNKISIESPFES